MIVWDHPEAVAGFVASLIPGCERGFGACQAAGLLAPDGRLEAGVAFHNWSPETGVIELSAASLRPGAWLRRGRMRELLAYPFDRLGCRAVVARHSERNAAARRLWQALGADETRIPDLRGPDEAECVALLRAETWRQSRYMR